MQTYYANRFHTDDIFHKLYFLVYMAGVIGLGELTLDSSSTGAAIDPLVVSACLFRCPRVWWHRR
jgi:hypothetical protein